MRRPANSKVLRNRYTGRAIGWHRTKIGGYKLFKVIINWFKEDQEVQIEHFANFQAIQCLVK